MKYTSTPTLAISILLSRNVLVHCFFDPLTLTAATSLLGSAVYYIINSNSVKDNIVRTSKFLCQKVGYCEGCEDYWIPGNVKSLEYDLRNNVFGQPLAIEIVLSALKRHLDKNYQPDRALVLSFHGGPGIGKNFISTKILQNMFRKKERSSFVHFFRSAIDFPVKENVDSYRKLIADKVMSKVLECQRSIFVFDEVEKMPNGILDVISSFVGAGQYGEHDFRRVIFILLSNVGDKLLMAETKLSWQSGQDREDMELSQLQKKLSIHSFNSEGGLKGTGLIKEYGISHYVPFLPLEAKHIIECLEREVVKQRQILSENLVRQVLEDLEFGPPPENLYAFAGCKGVAEKASVLIEREKMRKRRSQTLH